MFKVFITAKALADTCLNEGQKDLKEQSKWFRILSRQREIYTIGYTLNDAPYDEGDFSDEAILYRAQSSLGFVLFPEDDYVSEIPANPESVLQQPSAAFYLDISPEEASKIQEEYGVICQSTDKPFDESCLTDEYEVYDMYKGGKAIPWSTVFESVKKIPSNSLLIIDRNLFAYDGQLNKKDGKEKADGIYNTFFIMDNALPQTFNSTYHVTVLCEQKEENKNDESIYGIEHFEKVSKSLFKFVSSLKRDYPIIVEVIAFRKRAYYYNELTHTRQVISNYYRVTAENGLNTTIYSEDMASYYSQQLTVQRLYSTGLRRDTVSTPADTVRRMHEDYNKFLKLLMATHYTNEYYWYSCNNKGLTYQNYRNRLFL